MIYWRKLEVWEPLKDGDLLSANSNQDPNESFLDWTKNVTSHGGWELLPDYLVERPITPVDLRLLTFIRLATK